MSNQGQSPEGPTPGVTPPHEGGKRLFTPETGQTSNADTVAEKGTATDGSNTDVPPAAPPRILDSFLDADGSFSWGNHPTETPDPISNPNPHGTLDDGLGAHADDDNDPEKTQEIPVVASVDEDSDATTTTPATERTKLSWRDKVRARWSELPAVQKSREKKADRADLLDRGAKAKTAEQEAADVLKKKEVEAAMVGEVTKVIIVSPDGERQNIDSLDPVARARVEAAQKALFADINPRRYEALTQEKYDALSEAKKADYDPETLIPLSKDGLAEANKVVVTNGGQDIYMVQGDPRGIQVDEDTGKISVSHYTEQYREPKMVTRAGKRVQDRDRVTGKLAWYPLTRNINGGGEVAQVSFKQREVPLGDTGKTHELKTFRTLGEKDGEVAVLSAEKDVPTESEAAEKIFKDALAGSVAVRLSTRDFDGLKIDVVDVGKPADDAERKAINIRIIDTAKALALNDIAPTNGRERALIAGAGVDFMQQGLVDIAYLTEPWQKEGPKVLEVQDAEPVKIAFPSEGLLGSYHNLDLGKQAEFLDLVAEQNGIEPGSKYDLVASTPGGQSPEGSVALDDELRRFVTVESAIQMATTKEILENKLTPEQLAKISRPSEMVLVLLRGEAGFTDSRADILNAMEDANAIILELRKGIDEQSEEPGQIDTRRDIARKLIESLGGVRDALDANDENCKIMVDKLTGNLAKRTADEGVSHLLHLADTELAGSTGDARDKAIGDMRATLLELGVEGDNATALVEKLTQKPEVELVKPETAMASLMADYMAAKDDPDLRDKLRARLSDPDVHYDPDTRAQVEAFIDTVAKEPEPEKSVGDRFVEAIDHLDGIDTRERALAYYENVADSLGDKAGVLMELINKRKPLPEERSAAEQQVEKLKEQLSLVLALVGRGNTDQLKGVLGDLIGNGSKVTAGSAEETS